MMNASESPQSFSVLGGPLHRAGRRLGLVRGETNTIMLGLVLGWGPWLLILGLALIEGITDRMLSMALVAAHARLLLVIPLIFISETWVTPRMAACVATIARYGIVSPDDRLALDAEVSTTRRWANWWWPEVACLVLALVLDVTGSRLQTYGESSTYDPARDSLAFLVYVHVGLLVFRFLVFRTVWKLALWGWFLWRVSRLDLMPQDALGRANEAGALTIGLACATGSELARTADLAIVVDVGPEFISGSTRMKAGTAQRITLNVLSSLVSGGTMSVGRMTSVLFPMFMAAGAILPARHVPALVAASCVLQGLIAAAFFTWRAAY